jgi:hypothetical protein
MVTTIAQDSAIGCNIMNVAERFVINESPKPQASLGQPLTIDPRRVLLALSVCVATLLGCYVVTVAVRLLTTHHWLFGLVRLFDLDAEANVPTFFSVLQLAVAAFLLGIIGRQARQRADRFARHWLGLGAIFLFLSVDELAQMHELLGPPNHELLGPHSNSHMQPDGLLYYVMYYGWVIPYGLLAIAVAATYLRFLMHLPTRIRRLMILSALIYIGGAAGLEMYGGYLEARGAILEARFGPDRVRANLPYLTEVFFEEGMEMFGITLFIYTLLDYIRAITGRIQIDVGSAHAPSPSHALDRRGR